MMTLSRMVKTCLFVALIGTLAGCAGADDERQVSEAGEGLGVDPANPEGQGPTDAQGALVGDAQAEASGQGAKPRSLMQWAMVIASCEELTPCLRTLRTAFRELSECAVENFVDFWFKCQWPCRIYHGTFGAAGSFMNDEALQQMGEDFIECLALGVDKYFVKKCQSE